MKPTAIGKVLEESLERMELRKTMREKLALFIWEEAAGPEIARFTRPVRVQRGVMTVETASPTWSQQLTLLRPGLLEAINRRLGERLIKDLRFHSGQGLGAIPPAAGQTTSGRPADHEQPPLSPAELAVVDEWVAVIDDPAMRERWRQVMVKARAPRTGESGA
ncbi:MAG: DUF721 domain-containing protein [Bacillota bacterium]